MFPPDHTKLEGVDDGKRAFLMGNALVCGVITRVGKELEARLKGRRAGHPRRGAEGGLAGPLLHRQIFRIQRQALRS